MTNNDAAPGADSGQAASDSTPSNPAAAPDPGTGHAPDASGGKGTRRTPTNSSDSAADSDPSFFDPKSVPKELEPAYKHMQAAFTKAMQKASEGRQKAQFYDQFASDPVGHMQRLAQQYGMRLTRAEAAQAVQDQQQGGSGDLNNWQPNSWQEVIAKTKEETKRELLSQLQPLVQEVQGTKKQAIERQLSEIDPTWQQYEGEMVELLKSHPTLSKDPAMLYRMAVPPEVQESRATQRALQKLEGKAKAATAAGGSTTRRQGVPETDQRFTSVRDAWAYAQRQLEEQGIRPPRK